MPTIPHRLALLQVLRPIHAEDRSLERLHRKQQLFSGWYGIGDRTDGLQRSESSELAEQQSALTKLSAHTREVGIYTSDGANPLDLKQPGSPEKQFAEEGISMDGPPGGLSVPSVPELPMEIAEIPFEGFGLGL